jgi:very-short-patch-repair endonuclease
MNSNIVNLHEKLVDDFKPVADRMLSEGATQEAIYRAFQNYLGIKKRKAIKKPSTKKVGSILNGLKILNFIEKNKQSADSNAERRLYDLLTDHGIKFKFQYEIGPYRVDYLVGNLIVELDGPCHNVRKIKDRQRDYYLRKRGYSILHIPLYVLDLDPQAIISQINEEVGIHGAL